MILNTALLPNPTFGGIWIWALSKRKNQGEKTTHNILRLSNQFLPLTEESSPTNRHAIANVEGHCDTTLQGRGRRRRCRSRRNTHPHENAAPSFRKSHRCNSSKTTAFLLTSLLLLLLLLTASARPRPSHRAEPSSPPPTTPSTR